MTFIKKLLNDKVVLLLSAAVVIWFIGLYNAIQQDLNNMVSNIGIGSDAQEGENALLNGSKAP